MLEDKMSWFETSGLASFAKIALKEAQKTIDKALDIQDDETDTNSEHDSTGTMVNSSDAANAWESYSESFIGNVSDENTETVVTPPTRDKMNLMPNKSNDETRPDTGNEIECNDNKVHTISDNDITPDEHEYIGSDQNQMETSSATDIQTLCSDSVHSFEEINTSSLLDVERSSSSPDSEGKNSDIIKIGSGQTSGDELETATSSDIEILSCPNGDCSSTQSNCKNSPMKSGHMQSEDCMTHHKRGHSREFSEVSIESNISEENITETEKLLKRISELSELLEAREFKLIEVSRQNVELIEKNSLLKSQLDKRELNNSIHDVSNVTEEYTQSISALEKKFQQSIRERDALRIQLKSTRDELIDKISKEELDKVIDEKDAMIVELRKEGEQLSKQVLQHSNIIKKLRAKEKENNSLMTNQSQQIVDLTNEMERLKKSLSVKENIECNQIIAVNKLSTENDRIEKESLTLKNQIEDLVQKESSQQVQISALKQELNETKNQLCDMNRIVNNSQNLEKNKAATEKQLAQLNEEIQICRMKLQDVHSQNLERERKLTSEKNELLLKLEEMELKLEESADAVSLATKPLVRQLDSLHASMKMNSLTWIRQEKELQDKLEATQQQLNNILSEKKSSTLKSNDLESKVMSLTSELTTASLRIDDLNQRLETASAELTSVLTEKKVLEKENDKLEAKTNFMDKKVLELEEKLIKIEKDKATNISPNANVGSNIEQKSSDSMLQSLITSGIDKQDIERSSNNSSPTLSLGKMSLADSANSNTWQLDEMESISNSGRPSISGGVNASYYPTTTIYENLQSALKQREGEVHQLQWEIQRLQAERNFLTSEMSSMSNNLENINHKLTEYDEIQDKYGKLQHQYEALLEMYGEQVEKCNELKLDLEDVKEMYKLQIDDLLRQRNELAAVLKK